MSILNEVFDRVLVLKERKSPTVLNPKLDELVQYLCKAEDMRP